jgi:hypothetical protein
MRINLPEIITPQIGFGYREKMPAKAISFERYGFHLLV